MAILLFNTLFYLLTSFTKICHQSELSSKSKPKTVLYIVQKVVGLLFLVLCSESFARRNTTLARAVNTKTGVHTFTALLQLFFIQMSLKKKLKTYLYKVQEVVGLLFVGFCSESFARRNIYVLFFIKISLPYQRGGGYLSFSISLLTNSILFLYILSFSSNRSWQYDNILTSGSISPFVCDNSNANL